jgi:hypothetical protein
VSVIPTANEIAEVMSAIQTVKRAYLTFPFLSLSFMHKTWYLLMLPENCVNWRKNINKNEISIKPAFPRNTIIHYNRLSLP